MNQELTNFFNFFIKVLIIAFLIVLGWACLRRITKVLAFLLACWILLVILAFLLLPLIAIIWTIIYLAKK